MSNLGQSVLVQPLKVWRALQHIWYTVKNVDDPSVKKKHDDLKVSFKVMIKVVWRNSEICEGRRKGLKSSMVASSGGHQKTVINVFGRKRQKAKDKTKPTSESVHSV